MTLITSYCIGKKAVIISNFRTTVHEVDKDDIHYDHTSKLVMLSDSVGVFISGGLNYWSVYAVRIS